MMLKPGTRLRSQVDTTEVVVIRPIDGDAALLCGGEPMVAFDAAPQSLLLAHAPEDGPGSQMGKRYTMTGTSLEVLVTKPGRYGLAIGGQNLVEKTSRPLPSSD